MLKERITSSVNSNLEIMPEQFYFDKLRPHMITLLKEVKFDIILTSTVENTMNRADGFASTEDYKNLAESFDVLAGVLLSPKSTYKKSDAYIRASQVERDIVDELSTYIQDILTIIRFSKKEDKPKETVVKQRIGYNPETKQNII